MMLPIPNTPPHVSINRVRIIDLPGLPIDDAARGHTAYELLSTPAIMRYAWERAGALDLPTAFAQDTLETRLRLPPFVDQCLNSPREATQSAAGAIARRLGRNLGHILLALHRGDAVNRAARADWSAADWARWGEIEQVWLGGGLMSGRLGALIVDSARAFLAEVGYAGQPGVGLAAHPGDMPLLGAARYLPPDTRCALCLDFGHTQAKRVCLHFSNGTLVAVYPYPALPTELDWLGASQNHNPVTGRKVLDWMADTISETWRAVQADGFNPSADVILSVAAYVQGGRLLGNGLYANLSTLTDDARPLLTNAVSQRVGQALRVHLIHDGTAACAVHAGETNTAMILVGTALGVGFAPTDTDGLRPLASSFKIA